MSTTPENAAAPGDEAEGEDTIELAGEINNDRTRHVNVVIDDFDCPYVCSFARSACPWRCAPLTLRGEIT